MVICKLCRKPFRVVTNTHLSSQHGTSISDYNRRFGTKFNGIAVNVGTLPKSDPRYRKWHKSLKRRPLPWNTGYTKETHPGVAKISATFRKQRIDNFAKWREKAKAKGLIPRGYPPFRHSGNLAFLVGLVLGDGHVDKFPRTEQLKITLGTDKPLLWKYTVKILEKVFVKKPHTLLRKRSACVDLQIYQKEISKRLGIPSGNRGRIRIEIPKWILQNRISLIRCLRGLYEAEGSFCIHKPTYTYKLLFVNRNLSLLNVVYDGLQTLGFHPHRSQYKIQLSRRDEVYRCKKLLKFREYIIAG